MADAAVRRCDLAIVGSGGAGFAAAIAARRAGLKVVMVERGVVGGTCVNTGCVPSKALLAAANARRQALDERFPGIATQAGPVDFGELIEAKRTLVEGMRTQKYAEVAAGYGWEILGGTARLAGQATAPVLEVILTEGGTARVEAEHYLIATGSAPWAPPIDGLAEAGYLTSTSAMELTEPPGSLLVLGGNAVGLEQAQMFSHLGVDVTIVERLDRLAPFEEPEISQAITVALADEGIGVITNATVTSVGRDAGGYRVRGERDLDVGAAQLLVATGRRPVTSGLGLETVGVQLDDRGAIRVNQHLQTTNPRIWAAGDVTGSPQFVYLATAQGAAIVDNAFDQAGRTIDEALVPRVTFTSPAIAAVGLTEAQAEARAQGHAGLACECRILPLEQVPRALVNRDTRGVIKLVAERVSGRLRGVHVVADGAGELIQAAVYALACGMTTDQMAEAWSPFLTMTEGLRLAALSFTRDVSKLSCCAS
ncbi:MAG: mercury(II) reductase [Luteitalea sp.]|nr:mercury(II) reductase [Luteitalea sp.]